MPDKEAKTWEEIDSLVRDLTQVGKIPKSEVRHRITNLITTRENEIVEIIHKNSYHEQIGDGDGGSANGELVVNVSDVISAIKNTSISNSQK